MGDVYVKVYILIALNFTFQLKFEYLSFFSLILLYISDTLLEIINLASYQHIYLEFQIKYKLGSGKTL
jgi:hypothetical protein